MMKYGAEHEEHRFSISFQEAEDRGQWRDIFLQLHMHEGKSLPEGLTDPSILVICNRTGELVQIVLQDEGCDCEYQFTLMEKAQIEDFVSRLENV